MTKSSKRTLTVTAKAKPARRVHTRGAGSAPRADAAAAVAQDHATNAQRTTDTTTPEPAIAPTEPSARPSTDQVAVGRGARNATKSPKRDRQKKTRGPAKKDRLVELLRREGGATIEELMAEFDWQAHTCRGAISIAAKQLGVTAERIEKGRYRLPPA